MSHSSLLRGSPLSDRVRLWVGAPIVALLATAGCGGRDPSNAAALGGQVTAPAATTAALSHQAASRFLDQATAGPSPADIETLRSIGIEAWIGRQMALPATQIVTPQERREYPLLDRALSDAAAQFQNDSMQHLMVGAPDQLRVRVAWVLSNYIVVSVRRVQPYGGSEFFNLLMRHAFDRYDELLRQVTMAPAMGFFLDNATNNAQRLNENYARELLQLFSVGVVRLNQDGTVMRDAAGKPMQTYTQADVVGATRALTGWQFAPFANGTTSSSANWANYGVPMVPQDFLHDKGGKSVMGVTIPSGQSVEQDLRSLLAVILQHPNTAPFVSVRLIQGLTTSDPSPAYVSRISAVFKRTGGHLGEVVKAILTDPEARRGDDPTNAAAGFGRIREPHLAHTVVWRGLGCTRAPLQGSTGPGALTAYTQTPLGAPTVFGYTAPTHRAPGSNLLAPEQKLLVSDEFNRRLGTDWHTRNEQSLRDAGCDVDALNKAYAQGEDAMLDLLERRYLRGVMSPAVRQGIKNALRGQDWLKESASRQFGAMVGLLSLTPGFGASR